MALSDYQDLLPRLVREQGQANTSGDIDRVIASAVRQYSTDAPRQVVKLFSWPADGYTCLGVPSGLKADSTVLRAEYPIGQQPPEFIQVSTYLNGTTLGLVCEQSLPVGAQLRITFTADHELTGGMAPVDTIPLKHRDAVASYAAHLLCRELATQYSAERDSSIAADASNTESRARNYAARAREFRAAYYAALGVPDPQASTAGGSGSGGAPVVEGAGAVATWPSRKRPWFNLDWR